MILHYYVFMCLILATSLYKIYTQKGIPCYSMKFIQGREKRHVPPFEYLRSYRFLSPCDARSTATSSSALRRSSWTLPAGGSPPFVDTVRGHRRRIRWAPDTSRLGLSAWTPRQLPRQTMRFAPRIVARMLNHPQELASANSTWPSQYEPKRCVCGWAYSTF